MDEDQVASHVVDAAIAVHKALGPGLLESAYVAALEIEFAFRDLPFEREVPIQGRYRERPLGVVYRADLLVGNSVVLEIKSIHALEPIHTAQLLSYLRLSNLRLGFLLNFNVPLMKSGIKRVVNKL